VEDESDKEKAASLNWIRLLIIYQKEIERKDRVATMVDKIQSTNVQTEIHFLEGYSISEIPVPEHLVGKSIKDLNIRAEYGIEVFSIKNQSKRQDHIKVFPGPDVVLQKTDRITIAGEIKNINLIKSI